eukprot:Skav205478  [mRNA]  locus=scaffold830:239538:240893:+ [translate_table: standard]
MAFIFAISKHTGIPRAYDVPSSVALTGDLELEPYMTSDKSKIIGSLMQNQTKKDMLGYFESFGIPIRGTSKKSKEELATMIADKCVENLVPNEEEQPSMQVIDLTNNEAVSSLTALILSRALGNGGDINVFKDFVETLVRNDDPHMNDYAMELLEVAREVHPHFMEVEYQALLEKKGVGAEPEDEPSPPTFAKDFALNDLAKKKFTTTIRVIGKDNTFIYGFDPDTHFDDLFATLRNHGIDAGAPRDGYNLVVKNDRGSFAQDMDVVSDWTTDKGNLELTPSLQGGGKKTTKYQKKVSTGHADVKKKATEIGQSVNSSTRAVVSDLAELEKVVGQFWADADVNVMKAFENRFSSLDKKDMENILKVISADAGGDTEFKLRQMSHILFGAPIVNVKTFAEDLDKTISVCELAVKSVYLKGQDDMKMKTLRALAQTYLDRKIGATSSSADMDL